MRLCWFSGNWTGPLVGPVNRLGAADERFSPRGLDMENEIALKAIWQKGRKRLCRRRSRNQRMRDATCVGVFERRTKQKMEYIV